MEGDTDRFKPSSKASASLLSLQLYYMHPWKLYNTLFRLPSSKSWRLSQLATVNILYCTDCNNIILIVIYINYSAVNWNTSKFPLPISSTWILLLSTLQGAAPSVPHSKFVPSPKPFWSAAPSSFVLLLQWKPLQQRGPLLFYFSRNPSFPNRLIWVSLSTAKKVNRA